MVLILEESASELVVETFGSVMSCSTGPVKILWKFRSCAKFSDFGLDTENACFSSQHRLSALDALSQAQAVNEGADNSYNYFTVAAYLPMTNGI
jgi:hypothetical protein